MVRLSSLIAQIKEKGFFWQLALLCLVSTVAVYSSIAMNEQLEKYLPESKFNASTFNRKPTGMSGFYSIAQLAKVKCHAWILPYRELKDEHGTLLIVAPLESLAKFEVEQILAWVAKGNQLIYLDDFTFQDSRHLLKDVGIKAQEMRSIHEQTIPVEQQGAAKTTSPELTVSSDSELVGGTAVVSYLGKVVLARVKHGAGDILIGSAPSLCVNRRLVDRSEWPNFQFMFDQIDTKNGALWFDERCHGYSQNLSVFVFLARGAAGATFAQLVLLIAVAVLSAGQRFGSKSTVDASRSISNLDFISGLASAYRRAKANSAVLEIISQSFRNKLCKSIGISPHESTERIIEWWQRWQERYTVSRPQTPQSAKAVPALLGDLEKALAQPSISDNQLRLLIVSLDKITETLDKDMTTRQSTSRKAATR